MMPALRLTLILMTAPAAAAFAVQVAPPVAPRPARPPASARPMEPLKRLDDWNELDLKMKSWDDMSALHFKLPELEYDMPDMRFDLKQKMQMDMEMNRLDAKTHELDARMSEYAWKSEWKSDWSTDMLRGEARESFRTFPRAAWLQGDVADSLYRSAYELLNRGEWRRSATVFASIPQRYPNSGYVADALYWQAFSLYRIGNTDDLQTALKSLELMRSKYPQAKTQSDAAALMARIRGTLASRGDRDAERKLREAVNGQASQCDREDQAVRAEAMKSLAQTDPGSLPALAKRVLAKKDACSAPLRRTAVYLLGSSGDAETIAIMRDVALNDSEPEVRSTAIQYLARSPSDVAVNTLDEVLRTSTDQSVQRTAARALAANPSPRARQAVRALIERADAPERMRIEAIGGFEDSQRTTDEDAAYLRSIYTKVDNPRIKARIARVIGQLGGDQNDQWLLGLMRNNDEPLEVRSAALSRVASRKMPIADAVKLYTSVSDREMRQQLINIYGQRNEPEATDKLLDIAKNDTDFNLRRQAINALTRKNDPRATKLLLEIIDK